MKKSSSRAALFPAESRFTIPYGETTIALDHGAGDLCFVSHAHSDHVNGVRRKEQVIASEETIALAGLRATPHNPLNTKLVSAGHMLGARQIRVESDGKVSVYTGDLCLRDNLITKGAPVVQCDRLIIEATYADPAYQFPPYYDVCSEMGQWVQGQSNRGANVLVGCYELGKAQELVKLLNEYCSIAPVVTEKMDGFCSIYEKFGVKLDRVVIGSEEAEEAMKRQFVALVPMRNAKRYFARRLGGAFNRETVVAISTGWALTTGFNVDKAFPLSDHADHYDLKRYIEESGATEVEFFAGDGSSLKEYVRK